MKSILLSFILIFYINIPAQGIKIEFVDTLNGLTVVRQVSDQYPLPIFYNGDISDTNNVTPFYIRNLKDLPLRPINETIISDFKKENYTIIDEITDEMYLI